MLRYLTISLVFLGVGLQGCSKKGTQSVDGNGYCTQKYVDDHNAIVQSASTLKTCTTTCQEKSNQLVNACNVFTAAHSAEVSCKAERSSVEAQVNATDVHQVCNEVKRASAQTNQTPPAETPQKIKELNVTQAKIRNLTFKVLKPEEAQKVLDTKDLFFVNGKVMTKQEMNPNANACKLYPQTAEGMKLKKGMIFEAQALKVSYTMLNAPDAVVVMYKLKNTKDTRLFMVCPTVESEPILMRDYIRTTKGILSFVVNK